MMKRRRVLAGWSIVVLALLFAGTHASAQKERAAERERERGQMFFATVSHERFMHFVKEHIGAEKQALRTVLLALEETFRETFDELKDDLREFWPSSEWSHRDERLVERSEQLRREALALEARFLDDVNVMLDGAVQQAWRELVRQGRIRRMSAVLFSFGGPASFDLGEVVETLELNDAEFEAVRPIMSEYAVSIEMIVNQWSKWLTVRRPEAASERETREREAWELHLLNERTLEALQAVLPEARGRALLFAFIEAKHPFLSVERDPALQAAASILDDPNTETEIRAFVETIAAGHRERVESFVIEIDALSRRLRNLEDALEYARENEFSQGTEARRREIKVSAVRRMRAWHDQTLATIRRIRQVVGGEAWGRIPPEARVWLQLDELQP